jgi:Lipase (class 3)
MCLSYITGHSLGGALSVLAAYDIQAELDLLPDQVSAQHTR